MKLNDSKLREALSTIHPGPLAPADAVAVIDVARFTASADGRMDLNEMSTVARLAKIIYEMSGQVAPPVPAAPVSSDWMLRLDSRLVATGPRELAFASAYLIVLADGIVGKDELAVGGRLTGVLRITPARAKELTAIIERALQSTDH